MCRIKSWFRAILDPQGEAKRKARKAWQSKRSKFTKDIQSGTLTIPCVKMLLQLSAPLQLEWFMLAIQSSQFPLLNILKKDEDYPKVIYHFGKECDACENHDKAVLQDCGHVIFCLECDAKYLWLILSNQIASQYSGGQISKDTLVDQVLLVSLLKGTGTKARKSTSSLLSTSVSGLKKSSDVLYSCPSCRKGVCKRYELDGNVRKVYMDKDVDV